MSWFKRAPRRNEPPKHHVYHPPQTTPAAQRMLEEAKAFDLWSERKIWKHSRKLPDARCLDVTRSMLLKYGIEKEIVDRVFCYEEPGKP